MVELIYDTGSGWLVIKSELCTENCKVTSYDSRNSTSAIDEDTEFSQSYGSATLVGKLFKDKVCL